MEKNNGMQLIISSSATFQSDCAFVGAANGAYCDKTVLVNETAHNTRGSITFLQNR